MIYDFISLEKEGGIPLCTQLYKSIKQAIDEGKMQEGEKAPSIRLAATELGISRTTVETAYIRLCNEGYLDSRPQSGYFVQNKPKPMCPVPEKTIQAQKTVRYDFSSGRIDEAAADTVLWQKCVRRVLHESGDLVSYGEPQGERLLREAIADYAYAARGVSANPGNIVVGAGTQLLLTLFCSLYPEKGVIALDAPGFKQAERIFRDYGFKTVFVHTRKDKPLSKQLEELGANIYLYTPSAYSKKDLKTLKRFRRDLLSWAEQDEKRLILEDDYNGELRYTARPVPAMQQADTKHIVYFGSFSKLLLPSVRIAYMVLPDSLLSTYHRRVQDYNPTASKLEQLALTAYIQNGFLEKHLRRLKKLYYYKSKALVSAMEQYFGEDLKRISVLESSLSVVAHLETKLSDEEIFLRAASKGIRLDAIRKGHIWLSFAGIPIEDLEPAVKMLSESLR